MVKGSEDHRLAVRMMTIRANHGPSPDPSGPCPLQPFLEWPSVNVSVSLNAGRWSVRERSVRVQSTWSVLFCLLHHSLMLELLPSSRGGGLRGRLETFTVHVRQGAAWSDLAAKRFANPIILWGGIWLCICTLDWPDQDRHRTKIKIRSDQIDTSVSTLAYPPCQPDKILSPPNHFHC